jgi:primary-amine oxidase
LVDLRGSRAALSEARPPPAISRWRFPHFRDVCKAFRPLAAGLGVFSVCCAPGIGGAAAHPLDPLSGPEIELAVTLLRNAGLVDATTRFGLIDLDEPTKPAVLSWRPGQTTPRKAFAIARRSRVVYEAVIDLGAHKVDRWEAIPGVQSAITGEEWRKAQQITKDAAGWRKAMRKRGYAAFDKVLCTPLSAGVVANPVGEGHRLVRVTCFDAAGTSNIRARPIEGLVALVDLDASRVVRLTDSGPVPLARQTSEFGERPYPSASRRPMDAGAPPDFSVEGSRVRWKKWSFHYRMDRRVGLIVSLVRYDDAGRRRLVLYRGSIAEMFVPYMDDDPAWSFRSWLDVGEYGFGWLSSPLVAGTDCPADAVMLDATLPDDKGQPRAARTVACLFERDTGRPLWRHAESESKLYAGRPASELVLRSIPSVGNYDYVIDWVLTEAGTIRVDVGATGIDAVKGVAAGTMRDPTAAMDAASGMLVAPNLVAVNHDHFLSFRFDVDIDAAANTLMRQRLVRRREAENSGHRSLWTVVETPVTQEGPVASDKPTAPDVWRIVNPSLTNRLGQHPGYELRPGSTAISLLAPDDIAHRRATFSAVPLWVTTYDPHELYAAGTYPNQSRGGDGLPAFVARHRPVRNTDIVLWYTMGFHHLPRPEDWPVMTTVWRSVALVPYGFFERNPSLDLPAEHPHSNGSR